MKEQIRTISLVIIAICLVVQLGMQLTGNSTPGTSDRINASPGEVTDMVAPQGGANVTQGPSAVNLPQGATINKVGAASAAQNQKPKSGPDIPDTEMSFSEVNHDFGQMKRGVKKTYSFEITNTGNNPLKLFNLAADQGVTIVNYTQEEIAPGKKGKVEVEMNTENLESGAVKRIVHVNANAKPPHAHIELSADIVE